MSVSCRPIVFEGGSRRGRFVYCSVSLISMLSVSYAWTLLLAARDWKAFNAFPRSFLLIVTFLVLWWGTAFSAIGWMLAGATAPQPPVFSSGVYAARDATSNPDSLPGLFL
jgi:hypothetical protein